MDLSGTIIIPLPRQTVWQGLNDEAVLQAAIPGCESLEKVADDRIAATVSAKVGPVKAKFSGEITLSDLDPPNGYTLTGEGKGGAAGFAKGSAKVALADHPEGTELTYTADARVGGKLAQLGARLISGVADKMAAEFFEAFSKACVEAYGTSALTEAPTTQPTDVPVVAPVVETVGPVAAPEAPADHLQMCPFTLRQWLGVLVGIVAVVIVLSLL